MSDKLEQVSDETGEITTIVVEGGSKAPDTIDYSKIPEGKEPEVIDTPNGMNIKDLPDLINKDDFSG